MPFSKFLPVLALLRGTAFLLVANGLLGILLPLRGAAEGFSTLSLGLLGTSWAAGFVLACLMAPKLVSRVGHVRAFSSFSATMAIVTLLFGLIMNVWVWIGLRFISGFAIAGAFMVIESWLNEKSDNKSRGTVYAVYQMVCYIGITVGQMILPFAEVKADTLFMITAILMCLALMPTAMSTAETPRPLAETKLDLKALYANSPVACIGIFLIGGANGAWGTLGPVYGEEIGLSTWWIATMMSVTVLMGALTQLPAGRISDRMDRRFVLAAASGLCALVSLAIFIVKPTDTTAIIIGTGIYGGLAYILYSIAAAHANDHAKDGNFIAISGGMLLLYGVGTMVGPLVASGLMQQFGGAAIFLATFIFQGLVVAVVLWRISVRAAPMTKSIFRWTPWERSMTPQTIQLDPRAAEKPAN